LIFGSRACDARNAKDGAAARNNEESKSGAKCGHYGLTIWKCPDFKA
jgi:hypothetical protein